MKFVSNKLKKVSLMFLVVFGCFVAYLSAATINSTVETTVSRTTAKAGETITYTMKFKNTSSVASVKYAVKYDSNVLEVDETKLVEPNCPNCLLKTPNNDVAGSKVVITATTTGESSKLITGDLNMGSITFKVKANAPKGDTNITIEEVEFSCPKAGFDGDFEECASSTTINSAKKVINVTVPATGISISGTTGKTENIDVSTATTKNLTATVTTSNGLASSDNVTWESSNTNIATVSNGVVTFKGVKGSVTIKATAGNFTDSVTFNVVKSITGFNLKSDSTVNLKRKETFSNVRTEVLPADATEDATITWTSSAPTIAKVDANSGVVTAVGAGTAVITGTLSNAAVKRTVSYNVVVTTVPVTSLEIKDNTNKLELLRKEEKQLELKYNTDTTEADLINWSSSDEDVVTVDENGKLTAVGAGTATIKASIGALESSIEVEVTEIALKGITVSNKENSIEVGKTLTLEISLDPLNATDDVVLTYKSSDESIATVDKNGVVTGKKSWKSNNNCNS